MHRLFFGYLRENGVPTDLRGLNPIALWALLSAVESYITKLLPLLSPSLHPSGALRNLKQLHCTPPSHLLLEPEAPLQACSQADRR